MSALDEAASALEASYADSAPGAGVGPAHLPARAIVLDAVRLCFQLFYPGYHDRHELHTCARVATLHAELASQIDAEDPRERRGRALADDIVAKLPRIRETLVEDVRAAYDGDPAATSFDEIVLAYPGLVAITVHRVAHELYRARVPLVARVMSEWAHTQSGADIHPGARIGRRFFIDHATGVVVGETTIIGDDVKLYQGVTLGALSIRTDQRGRVIRDTKRHPTVENGVTIYANATVLGGQTVIGEGSIVGGGVFLTKSVPPRSRVTAKPAELDAAPRR